jgi:two-component sensor histidine kinase
MAFVLGLVLLLPAAYAIFQALSVYTAQAEQQVASLREDAAAVSGRQAELLAGVRVLLERLAAGPELRDGPPAAAAADPACAGVLREAAQQPGPAAGGEQRPGQNPVASLAAMDAAGRVACASSEALAGLDLGDTAWFREVKGRGGGGLLVSEVHESRDPDAGRTVVLAVPLGRDGRFAGALAATLRPSRLPAVPAGLELRPGAVAYLVDAQAQLVHPPTDPARVTLPGWAGILRLVREPGSAAIVAGPGGRLRFLAAPVERDRLYALVGLPAPHWSWLERELVLGLILPVLMLALAVVGIWIATDYLVNRHVHALAAAARGYASGRHAGWPSLRGAPTELRELAQVLARTTGELGAREAELEASLAQKEVLLREIHHRVKNNLQVVTSLLNLRAQTAASPAARQAMLEAQSRVKALALVHRDLYEGGGELLGTVDLGSFLGELCHLLEDTVPGRAAEVEVRVSLEPARVAVDKAVPVSLFLTEALSNALRHAFPDGRRGTVAVRLLGAADAGGDGAPAATARLEIEDDGVGFDPPPPPGGAGGRGAGLGMTLMRMLAGQAGGRLAVGAGPAGGTLVGLEFPVAPPPLSPPGAAG